MSDNINLEKDRQTQNKPKTFYSVNLTEGRIFIIFVSLVLIFVIIFFAIFLLISKISKNNFSTYKQANNESTTTLNFYDASAKDELTSDANNISDRDSSKETNEKKENVVENKEDIKESNNEPKINLDNSEILYSSKFKNVDESNFKSKKSVSVTTTTTIKDKITNNVKSGKRYVVQVGSYLNKDTALEIENFYKKLGYPTYIQSYLKDGKTYYRLRIGPFKDKKVAENYLVSLKQSKYGKNSYISIINI